MDTMNSGRLHEKWHFKSFGDRLAARGAAKLSKSCLPSSIHENKCGEKVLVESIENGVAITKEGEDEDMNDGIKSRLLVRESHMQKGRC